MKKTLAGLFMFFVAIGPANAVAQQIPFLSELLSRNEEFVRLYYEKRRAGVNLTAVQPLRQRCEDAFKRGGIPDILEALSQAVAALTGKKWDDRQKFVASLTLETDRLVVEPNQVLQVSLTRMFPASIEKAFPSAPTVTFSIASVEGGSRRGDAQQAPALSVPLVIAEHLTVAETSTNSSRRLLLPDGAYQVVAQIEAAGKQIAEIKRPFFAISDFSDSVAQMSKTIAGIKTSADSKARALVATPEFKLQRLAQLNKSRGEVDLNPNEEIDHIEVELAAIAKGQNPFASQRGEIERAYQASDQNLIPYRLYVPRSYDGASPGPLVVMLHGALGDERYYFGGLFDPAIIKGEADRRGCILLGVNGRGRFSLYAGPAQKDALEAIAAVARDYKIDASRIYLTGHSTGGLGTWLVAASKPDQFAAIAAVSGGPPAQGNDLAALLEKLKGLPAMLVHGAQDGVVPAQLSRSMASAAEKAGLKVTYLEVPDGDHLSVAASTFPAIMDFFDKNARPSSAK